MVSDGAHGAQRRLENDMNAIEAIERIAVYAEGISNDEDIKVVRGQGYL